MLNYGYGILESEVWRAVHFADLDPYGGFLHADRPGKPSLVLDLMEEFRQQLIDKSIIKLISRREIEPENFLITENVCSIDDKARKTLITEVLERLEEYIVVGDEKVKWCDQILNQARNIGKYLRGEIPRYEGFWLRW
jgi:CRISPR-associated protein Cas1